ncbi:hypothetical protein [Coleofasciculus sp. F4-SAH-05]|uniref:hypothetical protein n=1 Tax=Coleofasciculus sp. F4-SAH-05 TaxID=3069525 RepID=UPI0032F836E2
MDENQRKHHGQIEIADLISEAVSNATARRNQVLDSEEPLSSLSDDRAGSVKGGQIFPLEPVVCGGMMGDPQDIIRGRFV